MTQVPFVDLRVQAQELREEYDTALWSVIDRAAYTMGPELKEFETAFADYCETVHCSGVSSGTDAVKLALLGAGVAGGDEVIVPVNTFIATAEAVSHIGATPVFVDCDPETALIAVDAIESAITGKTRAVLPVHLYGQVADMDTIGAIAARHGLAVVEDACQAHGARYKARRAGSFGHAAAFSFYPGKNLGALGDGGAVTTLDAAVAEKVMLYRNHGQSDKYTHQVIGYCDRLHNLQAAVLAIKLRYLDEWNEARRAAAARYEGLLAAAGAAEIGIRPVTCSPDAEHVYHLFVIQAERRDELREALAAKGIESGIHYPIPLHLQPAYDHLGYRSGQFPAAEGLAKRILSLPMFPQVAAEQQEYVVECLVAASRGA